MPRVCLREALSCGSRCGSAVPAVARVTAALRFGREVSRRLRPLPRLPPRTAVSVIHGLRSLSRSGACLCDLGAGGGGEAVE